MVLQRHLGMKNWPKKLMSEKWSVRRLKDDFPLCASTSMKHKIWSDEHDKEVFVDKFSKIDKEEVWRATNRKVTPWDPTFLSALLSATKTATNIFFNEQKGIWIVANFEFFRGSKSVMNKRVFTTWFPTLIWKTQISIMWSMIWWCPKHASDSSTSSSSYV